MRVKTGGSVAALGRLAQWGTAALLLAVAAIAIVDPRPSNTAYRQWVVITTVVLLASACVLGWRWWSAGAVATAVRARPRLAMWVVTGAGLLVCGPVALLGGYRAGWDAGGLLHITQLLGAGRRLDPTQLIYLSSYPNNQGLLALLLLARRLGMSSGLDTYTVMLLLNCACLAVVLVSSFVVTSRFRGPVAGVAAQLVCIGLVGLSPWMSVAYTDVLTTPIPIASFALIALATKPHRTGRGRIALLVGALVLLGIGYALKPTVAVAVAALIVTALLAWPLRSGRRQAAVALAVLALGGAVVAGSAVATQAAAAKVMAANGLRLDPTRAVPPDRFVLDGVQQGPHGTTKVAYGAYSAAVVKATYGMTTQQMKDYSRRQVMVRLQALGVGGYLRFAANKTAWNWGDGMFYAFGESAKDAKPSSLLSTSSAARFVASVNHAGGQWYPLRSELAQALWVLVLLMGGVGLIVAPPRPATLLLALTVLGIAAFTTIFQARSRYLLTYVPVVVTLACIVVREPRLVRTLWTAREPVATVSDATERTEVRV